MPTKDDLTTKYSTENLSQFIKVQPFITKEASKTIEIGSTVKVGYRVEENGKERVQVYEGLIISKQNRGANKTFTIGRKVQGVSIEQIFFACSQKIAFIISIQQSKVRRAKLFFTRHLSSKAIRLKLKQRV